MLTFDFNENTGQAISCRVDSIKISTEGGNKKKVGTNRPWVTGHL